MSESKDRRGAPKGRFGNERHKPSPLQRETARRLAAMGVAREHIAAQIGVSQPILRRDYETELGVGQAELAEIAAKAFRKKIEEGDGRMIELAMKRLNDFEPTKRIDHANAHEQPFKIDMDRFERAARAGLLGSTTGAERPDPDAPDAE